MNPSERHVWSRLNPLQLGRYAEYLVEMEFTLYGELHGFERTVEQL